MRTQLLLPSPNPENWQNFALGQFPNVSHSPDANTYWDMFEARALSEFYKKAHGLSALDRLRLFHEIEGQLAKDCMLSLVDMCFCYREMWSLVAKERDEYYELARAAGLIPGEVEANADREPETAGVV